MIGRFFGIRMLAAGLAAFGLQSLVSIANAQATAVVINEINYGPSDTNNPAEFIELYNNGTNAVDLSGWKFDSGVTYTFPAATILPTNGYIVISGEPAKFSARWGFMPLGPWSGKLSNEGEQLRLRDAANSTVDTVTYGAGFPWPTMARGDGSSMELIHPDLDNDLGGSWRSSGLPSADGGPQLYVPPNDSSWRYRKGNSEASTPTSAWRALDFVENGTWLTGQTSIGYADNDDRTVLNDMWFSYSSLFLRRTFTIESGEVPTAIKLKVRVDDGCIVWINGVEVARFYVPANLVPLYNSVAQEHEAGLTTFEETNLLNAASFLVEGSNIVAVQAFNSSTFSDDFSIDLALEELPSFIATTPTPGDINSCYSNNVPPSLRQVNHSPLRPTNGQPVTITAKITDPDGVASVSLTYQVVNPGAYIRKTDAAYTNGWTAVAMVDDGTNGDTNAGDFIYTAVIPGSAQTHRRVVRYRIQAADLVGNSVQVPYADDGSPNFAYFVYNSFPQWTGAFNPGVTPNVTYPPSLLQSLPAYHLVAANSDVVNCQYNTLYNHQRFYGTLVYNGVVYDHIQFRNRGENSTYFSGKNKWRFDFNTARNLQALDNWGRPYAETWDELNLNACAGAVVIEHRGMAGVDEAVSLRLYELLGTPSPKSHHLHFRVIDDASETGASQFQGGDPAGVNGGDLWGLYLAVEVPDGSFLDERSLEDGNVYKIESSLGDKKHQADNQVLDSSDWTAFLAACKSSQTEAWWRTNLHLDAFYNFHAGNRILGNVDLRQGFNHYFYHAPDNRWQVIPWDLDLMFVPKSHQSGTIDQTNCLNLPALRIEFKNRARELVDLVCADPSTNGGQIGQLIDEYARIVVPAGTATNWAMLDAAMWNYNPRSVNGHFGNFYKTPYSSFYMFGGQWTRTLTTADFAGSIKYLTDYTTDTFPANLTWTVNNGDQRGYGNQFLKSEAADATVPQRPTATYLGTNNFALNDLRFSASAYAGVNAFVAEQWRIAEISAPGIPLHNPAQPRIYEVTDVWRSSELPSTTNITIPSAALQVGHTYRVRVRHKDITGRWSRWSEAVQFVTTLSPTTVTSNKLVISEMMYNPPALSSIETNAGYTDKQLFEYIELLNISTNTLDLEGLAFTTGIGFAFGPGVSLAPRERILIAKDTNAFALRYGAVGRVAGAYTGNLDNAGERVVLTSMGQAVRDYTYSDGSHPPGTDPWPTLPDGTGPSLVLMNPELAPDHNVFSNWRPSTSTNGCPGRADPITYTEWSRRYPGLGNPTDDSDTDGWSNQAEYFFGGLPLDANSHPSPVSGKLETLFVNSQNDAYFVFSCTRSAESGDVNYIVEFSPDLVTWPVTGVYLNGVDNGNGTITEYWRSPQPASNNNQLFARARAQFK